MKGNTTLQAAIRALGSHVEDAPVLTVEESLRILDETPPSNSELGMLVSTYEEILAGQSLSEDSEYQQTLSLLAAAKQRALIEAPEDEDSPEKEGDDIGGDLEGDEDKDDPFAGGEDRASAGAADPAPDADAEDSGEASFGETYPELEEDKILEAVYERWLAEIKNKPFYKTLKNYATVYRARRLSALDRVFLLRLIKAISSLITHIVIEAELRAESIVLLEKYYDDLVQCMNTVVHSADKEDVFAAFAYILDFLQLPYDDSGDEPDSSGEDSDSGSSDMEGF